MRLFDNLKEITICGNIAQVVFMHIFGINNPDNEHHVKQQIAEKDLDLYFVEHPAASLYDDSNRLWAYRQEIAPTRFQKTSIPRRDK